MTYTLPNLPQAAKYILENCQYKILLFYGEMGVGKTTLIKELAKQLGHTDWVSSPTFSLVNEYENSSGKLYHFDFYRINNEEEALSIGVEEYLYSGEWCFIEWPEKVLNLLPKESHKIIINKNENDLRNIIIE